MAEGVRLKIDVRGLEPALKSLGRAVKKTQDPKGLFEAIGLALVASTQHRFETETGPDGSPWPPSIRALAEGGKTLTDTAAFRNSVSFEATPRSVAVGSDHPGAAVHQFGATIVPVAARALAFSIGGRDVFAKKVTIPARPYLGLDDDDVKEIVALAEDWLDFENEGAAR